MNEMDKVESIEPKTVCTVVTFTKGYSICSHPVSDWDMNPCPSLRLKSIDEVMNKWDKEFQKIYDHRTAGDNTFLGTLVYFVRDLMDNGHMPKGDF